MKKLAAVSIAAMALFGCDDSGSGGGDPIVVPQLDMGDAEVLPDAAPDVGLEPDEGVGPECQGDLDLQPPILNEHVAAWDPDNAQMIVFGGNTAVPEMCGFPPYTFESTTWIYDPAQVDAGCSPWTEIDGGPPGRTRAASAWGGGYMWVYGGRVRQGTSGPYQVYRDLWRFDPSDRTWTEMDAAGPDRPSARFNTSLVWDSTRRQLVLYAGNGSGQIDPSVLNDVWTYDPELSKWSPMETAGDAPSRRMWHAAIYDANRDRMVIHGGGDETAFFNNAQYFAELRALDMSTGEWSVLHPGTPAGQAPQGRFWGGLVHDVGADLYVMFGGHDDGNLGNRNDLWQYDPTRDRWAPVMLGDVFNAPANGFCDFPADFTRIMPGTPERRNAHSVVWADGEMITFGGKTDCGAVNDVWHWEAEGGWRNPVIASDGEMCIRWRANPDNCVNMCF